MTSIPLRAYTREIEGLIEHEQRLDEAIAHCRQILTTYPKCLEAYRLLGKAYLEGRRYSQAVDIFERLLVAVPDDFVAHVGMSIIADDQSKLDDAIWHMERAFEVQPSNPAIQGELQRLFGRRDGTEPPKIRLTRGALAHMYVQGQLYNQAISEIRTVLNQDAERADLQVLLAKAYFHGGQKTEAADVCAKLLADYPYCFDANRLMVELLTGTKSVEAAQEYRQRVIELDPYAEFAQGSIFASDAVPDKSVTLERLEYVGQAPEVRPLLGMGFGEPAAGQPSPVGPASVPALRPEDDMPAFLRGARTADVVAPETPKAEEPAVEAAPSDLPDWVKALAPLEVGETEEAEPADAENLPWLHAQAAEPGEPEATTPAEGTPSELAEGEIPAWLRDVESRPEEPAAEPELQLPPLEPEVEPSSAIDIGSLGTAPVEKEEGLAWLESLAAKHGASSEEMITPEESRTEETPEWVGRASEIARQATEAWTSMDVEPAAAAPPESPAPSPVTPPASEKAEAEGEVPEKVEGAAAVDWLQSLAKEGTYSDEVEETSSEETPGGEATIPEWPRVTPPPRVGEEPSWLESAAPSVSREPEVTQSEPSGERAPEVHIPDWLADFDKEKSSAPPSPPAEGPPPWLESQAEPAAEAPQPSTPMDWRPAAAQEAAPAPTLQEPELEEAPSIPSVSEEAAPPASTREVPVRSPKQPMPSLGSAQTELGRGNIAAALELYGRLIHKGKSLSEIIRDLRDALYRYPVEVPIWQALGDAYMRANRLQDALDAYTKAEELLR